MTLARALPLALFASALAASAADRPAGNAEHGGYIAMHVAMCVQCHSPRDEKGKLIETKLFAGGPVPVVSPWRDTTFAAAAPMIAGFPGYTEKEAIRLLMEGVTREGRTPRPPMPPFRMSAEDARDVVAYLKGLERKP